ncbi:Hpt domain-containing protein [Marinicella sp. S1101]|uniref:Hpt domain-containing protein n=1 Tax=Marinicella marina TaxID=2996016 RepID=UPI002260C0D0|nr:Hpt domain-containing protein [Marinicella marina]MCX7552988.1 Hpt domain-containing protein [Marinicella marina]MDJ1139702.1 Hpt domain-containing protein [Marinicella marina]
MYEALKQKYVASFTTKSEQINQALGCSDIQALTVLVHQMAGSSGSYGFDQISALCIQIEDLILKTHNINPAVEQKCQQLLTLLSSHINDSKHSAN